MIDQNLRPQINGRCKTMNLRLIWRVEVNILFTWQQYFTTSFNIGLNIAAKYDWL